LAMVQSGGSVFGLDVDLNGRAWVTWTLDQRIMSSFKK